MKNPLVISGMFRSGTTLLWRILSADPGMEVYIPEPLHPQLPEEIERLQHYDVYRAYPQALRRWSPSFYRERVQLGKGDSFPELEQYLRCFLHKGALIKFVRMTLRTAWLLDTFPDSAIVHIVRDPRAVCNSYLKYLRKQHPSSGLRRFRRKLFPFCQVRELSIKQVPYWAADYFEMLSVLPRWQNFVSGLIQEPVHTKVLGLWRINVEQCLDDLEPWVGARAITVTYEDLLRQPFETLNRIYAMLGMAVPEEVLREGRGESLHDLGGNKKWQEKISTQWIDEWRQVDNRVWQYGLSHAGLYPLMERLGYPPD